MKMTRREMTPAAEAAEMEARRAEAKRLGTPRTTFRGRIARGVDPARAAQPEHMALVGASEEVKRNKRARRQWKRRNPDSGLSDAEIDAIIDANRPKKKD